MALSVQRRKVWLTPTTRAPCSNTAKTRNPLKLPGVPQTNETISAASGPKFTILWGHVEEILLLNKFFFLIVDTCLSCEDIARQGCSMVPRRRFFASCISSDCMLQYISDLHSKFAIRPHCVEVWQTASLRRLRLGEEKKERRKKETTGQKYNGLPYSIGRP